MVRTRVAMIVVGSALLAACAARAPNYTTSPSSTQALQSAKVQPVRVGEFTADPGAANKSIALRASTMEAPQGSYAAYLADAVKTELDLVKLYSATSGTEISGVLIKNEMNTGLAVTGNGTIQAKFVVRRDGMVRYDKTKLAQNRVGLKFHRRHRHSARATGILPARAKARRRILFRSGFRRGA